MAFLSIFSFATVIQWNYHPARTEDVAEARKLGRSARRTDALKTAAIRQPKLSSLYDFFTAASANFKRRQKTHSDEVVKCPREYPFRFQSTAKLTTAVDCP
jgi:hypothetical protein